MTRDFFFNEFQVDAHVSKHLFQECIQRYLASKTRILATHQLQYIKGVDGIILLEQGRMKYFSHYQDLLEYRPEYGVLLTAENEMIDDSSLEKSINIRRQFSSSSNRVSEAINTYKQLLESTVSRVSVGRRNLKSISKLDWMPINVLSRPSVT